jgi:hypothetical protein
MRLFRIIEDTLSMVCEHSFSEIYKRFYIGYRFLMDRLYAGYARMMHLIVQILKFVVQDVFKMLLLKNVFMYI